MAAHSLPRQLGIQTLTIVKSTVSGYAVKIEKLVSLMSRIRALLIAESANPEWASVPLVGWSIAAALSRQASCHIVTQVRNREAFLRSGLKEGRDFTAIDSEKVALRLWRISERLRGGSGKGWTTITALSSLAYYAFEQQVWSHFKQRIRSGEYDIVHRITPLSPTSQSLIARRLASYSVPFVVGPLNGGLPWPKNLRARQHAEKDWLSYLRAAYKLLPGYRSMRKSSAALIVGSQYTLADMPMSVRSKCVYIPENGIDPGRFNKPRCHRAMLPLSVAFLGRLVPYKGADILIRAAADHIRSGNIRLKIVGDGPQKPSLLRIVEEMRLNDGIEFQGWVPHHEVQNHLQSCDVLALPSIREFGGGAVLEAMALGVVPVVADYGGPSELVRDEYGVRVPFEDEPSLELGFRNALDLLVDNPHRIDALGSCARDVALKEFTWDAKAEKILAVYDNVLSEKANFARHVALSGRD